MAITKSNTSSDSFSNLLSTERSIDQLKLLAKHLRKAFPEKDTGQAQMLETCSKALGFANWHELNAVHQASLTAPIKDSRLGALEFMTREKGKTSPSLTQILPMFSFDSNLENLIQIGKKDEISEILFNTLKGGLEWADYEKEELIQEFYNPSVDSRDTLEKAVSVLEGKGFIHKVDYTHAMNTSNDEAFIQSKLVNWVENSDHPDTAGDFMVLANIHFEKAQSLRESGSNQSAVTTEMREILNLLDKAKASNEKHGKDLIQQIHAWKASTLLDIGRPVDSLKSYILANEANESQTNQSILCDCPAFESPLDLKAGTVSHWDEVFEMLSLCKTVQDQKEFLSLAPMLIKAADAYLDNELDLPLPIIYKDQSNDEPWSGKKTIMEMQKLVNVATQCGMDVNAIACDDSIEFDAGEVSKSYACQKY